MTMGMIEETHFKQENLAKPKAKDGLGANEGASLLNLIKLEMGKEFAFGQFLATEGAFFSKFLVFCFNENLIKLLPKPIDKPRSEYILSVRCKMLIYSLWFF